MFYVTRCTVANRTVTRTSIAGYKYRKLACDVADFLNVKERKPTTYYQVYTHKV